MFFTPFFTAFYIVEWLVLQTIYVLNKEILQFLGLKSYVYNQERVIMAHVHYFHYHALFRHIARFIIILNKLSSHLLPYFTD